MKGSQTHTTAPVFSQWPGVVVVFGGGDGGGGGGGGGGG